MVASVSNASSSNAARLQQESKAHVVAKGDTLSGIAKRHNVALDELLRANPQIKDANLIHPGQHVQLPAAATPPTATEPASSSRAPGDARAPVDAVAQNDARTRAAHDFDATRTQQRI